MRSTAAGSKPWTTAGPDRCSTCDHLELGILCREGDCGVDQPVCLVCGLVDGVLGELGLQRAGGDDDGCPLGGAHRDREEANPLDAVDAFACAGVVGQRPAVHDLHAALEGGVVDGSELPFVERRLDAGIVDAHHHLQVPLVGEAGEPPEEPADQAAVSPLAHRLGDDLLLVDADADVRGIQGEAGVLDPHIQRSQQPVLVGPKGGGGILLAEAAEGYAGGRDVAGHLAGARHLVECERPDQQDDEADRGSGDQKSGLQRHGTLRESGTTMTV
jgi:hypothetical protein